MEAPLVMDHPLYATPYSRFRDDSLDAYPNSRPRSYACCCCQVVVYYIR